MTQEEFKIKFGKRAYWDLLELIDKPYSALIISKRFNVSERTAKRWKYMALPK